MKLQLDWSVKGCNVGTTTNSHCHKLTLHYLLGSRKFLFQIQSLPELGGLLSLVWGWWCCVVGSCSLGRLRWTMHRISTALAVMRVLYQWWRGKWEGGQEAFNLSVWSWVLGCDQKNETLNATDWDEFLLFLRDRVKCPNAVESLFLHIKRSKDVVLAFDKDISWILPLVGFKACSICKGPQGRPRTFSHSATGIHISSSHF